MVNRNVRSCQSRKLTVFHVLTVRFASLNISFDLVDKLFVRSSKRNKILRIEVGICKEVGAL